MSSDAERQFFWLFAVLFPGKQISESAQLYRWFPLLRIGNPEDSVCILRQGLQTQIPRGPRLLSGWRLLGIGEPKLTLPHCCQVLPDLILFSRKARNLDFYESWSIVASLLQNNILYLQPHPPGCHLATLKISEAHFSGVVTHSELPSLPFTHSTHPTSQMLLLLFFYVSTHLPSRLLNLLSSLDSHCLLRVPGAE